LRLFQKFLNLRALEAVTKGSPELTFSEHFVRKNFRLEIVKQHKRKKKKQGNQKVDISILKSMPPLEVFYIFTVGSGIKKKNTLPLWN
jgi:hypothetical protein